MLQTSHFAIAANLLIPFHTHCSLDVSIDLLVTGILIILPVILSSGFLHFIDITLAHIYHSMYKPNKYLFQQLPTHVKKFANPCNSNPEIVLC